MKLIILLITLLTLPACSRVNPTASNKEVVLCDGKGKYCFTDKFGELWPTKGMPEIFHSYDDAQRELNNWKKFEKEWDASKHPRDTNNWHVCE